MAEREVWLSGLSHRQAVTRLLQRARLADPRAGIWEAADLQWWWRLPRASDELDLPVVLDGGGHLLAAVAVIDWGDQWACEPLVVPGRSDDLLPRMWAAGLDVLDRLGPVAAEVTVGDHDQALTGVARASGFEPSGGGYAETWMAAPARPTVPALPDGYHLFDRAVDHGPHPMAERNGPEVAARLAQTSLYRPDLDLCIRDAAGQVVAYGLFWLDPVTGVGMLEPMRTEDAHQRRGLGGHLLAEGLSRLAARGATRLKVSYELDNPASARLYLSAGFVAGSTSRVHQRAAAPA